MRRTHVTSVRANRDSGSRPHRADPAALHSAWRTTADGSGSPVVVPLSIEVKQRLVLNALVEGFGGEATVSALSLRLTRQLGWTLASPGPKLIDVLQDLSGLGALSLEANSEDDFIIRLLPGGAELYV